MTSGSASQAASANYSRHVAVDADILQLWDQLALCPASRTVEGVELLLTSLASMAGVGRASWIATVWDAGLPEDDPLYGWRAQVVWPLGKSPENLDQIKREIELHQQGDLLDSTRIVAAGAGRFRGFSLRDELGIKGFCEERERRPYLNEGEKRLVDRMLVIWPTSASTECCILLDRQGQQKPFSGSDLRRVMTAIRGVPGFHRQSMNWVGLTESSSSPLTPTERRVVAALLEPGTEEEIATGLGMAASTVHSHAKSAFRKLGVRGRKGLADLWLNAGSSAWPLREPVGRFRVGGGAGS